MQLPLGERTAGTQVPVRFRCSRCSRWLSTARSSQLRATGSPASAVPAGAGELYSPRSAMRPSRWRCFAVTGADVRLPLGENCGNCGNLSLCTFPLFPLFPPWPSQPPAPPSSEQRVHLPAPRRSAENIPTALTTRPPSAGPTMREMFIPTPFSARAGWSCCLGTRPGSTARKAGVSKAVPVWMRKIKPPPPDPSGRHQESAIAPKWLVRFLFKCVSEKLPSCLREELHRGVGEMGIARGGSRMSMAQLFTKDGQ